MGREVCLKLQGFSRLAAGLQAAVSSSQGVTGGLCDPSLSPGDEACDLGEGIDAAPAASVVNRDTAGFCSCLSKGPLFFSALKIWAEGSFNLSPLMKICSEGTQLLLDFLLSLDT